jgi:hypothetical protein
MNCNRFCLAQGCTNPGRQVSLTTKFLMVEPNVCGFSIWNLLRITYMTTGISGCPATFFGGWAGLYTPSLAYTVRSALISQLPETLQF